MPVIVVATIRPLRHRDEVTVAMLAAVERVHVVVLAPVLGGDPAKGQL
jgi:hypothetical protein